MSPGQQEVFDSPKRFKIVKAGRRFGKSVFVALWQVIKAANGTAVDHWYVARTYKQAKNIIWREFMSIIPKELIKTVEKRELEIELTNGAKICLKGSDKEDSLRGSKVGSLVMDEAAFQKPHLWPVILRPMTADLEAPVLFISSPKTGWFTRLHSKAMKEKQGLWGAWHFTIYDNPYMKRSEIEEIRKTTPERTFNSEYMALESEEDGQVYPEFTEANIVRAESRFKDYMGWRAVCGLDYGLRDDSAAAWLHFKHFVYVQKEHIKNGWDVNRHSEVIDRLSKGRRIDRGDYPLDESAFRREATSMTSISEQFRKCGIPVCRSERDRDAGIDVVKRFLRGNGDSPWLFIDAGCKETIRAFEEWEHGQHEPDILAALRYGLVHGLKRRLTTIHKDDGDIRGVVALIESGRDAAAKDEFVGRRFKRNIADHGWQVGFDEDYGVPH